MAPAVDPELNKIPFGTPILHAPAQLNEALEAAARIYVKYLLRLLLNLAKHY